MDNGAVDPLDSDKQKWYSISEFSELIGQSEKHVRKLINHHGLPHYQKEDGCKIWIIYEWYEHWLENNISSSTENSEENSEQEEDSEIPNYPSITDDGNDSSIKEAV